LFTIEKTFCSYLFTPQKRAFNKLKSEYPWSFSRKKGALKKGAKVGIYGKQVLNFSIPYLGF